MLECLKMLQSMQRCALHKQIQDSGKETQEKRLGKETQERRLRARDSGQVNQGKRDGAGH